MLLFSSSHVFRLFLFNFRPKIEGVHGIVYDVKKNKRLLLDFFHIQIVKDKTFYQNSIALFFGASSSYLRRRSVESMHSSYTDWVATNGLTYGHDRNGGSGCCYCVFDTIDRTNIIKWNFSGLVDLLLDWLGCRFVQPTATSFGRRPCSH